MPDKPFGQAAHDVWYVFIIILVIVVLVLACFTLSNHNKTKCEEMGGRVMPSSEGWYCSE